LTIEDSVHIETSLLERYQRIGQDPAASGQAHATHRMTRNSRIQHERICLGRLEQYGAQ
jgi:hypothetical protein